MWDWQDEHGLGEEKDFHIDGRIMHNVIYFMTEGKFTLTRNDADIFLMFCNLDSIGPSSFQWKRRCRGDSAAEWSQHQRKKCKNYFFRRIRWLQERKIRNMWVFSDLMCKCTFFSMIFHFEPLIYSLIEECWISLLHFSIVFEQNLSLYFSFFFFSTFVSLYFFYWPLSWVISPSSFLSNFCFLPTVSPFDLLVIIGGQGSFDVRMTGWTWIGRGRGFPYWWMNNA